MELEFGPCFAEIGRPGVELLDAALRKGVRLDEALHGEEFGERIGDRRPRGRDQRSSRILCRVDEPDFHVEVPGPLGTFRVDAFQRRLVGGEREFAELLHFVDDQGSGEQRLEDATRRIEAITQDLARRIPTRGDAFTMTIGDRRLTERKAAGETLIALVRKMKPQKPGATAPIAAIGGFPILARTTYFDDIELRFERALKSSDAIDLDKDVTPLGLVSRLESWARRRWAFTPVPIVSDEPMRILTWPPLTALNRRCFAEDFFHRGRTPQPGRRAHARRRAPDARQCPLVLARPWR